MATKKTKVSKKYTAGLSQKEKKEREAQIRKRAKASREGKPKYTPLKGDKGAKTKPSKYTTQAKRSGLKGKIEANMKSNTKEGYLSAVAKATGMPKGILRQVHERGARAWATGHIPGASQKAWARARVLSFVQGGKTTKMADKALYAAAKKRKAKK